MADPEGDCYGKAAEVKCPQQEKYALCRCDNSKNKPLYDSNHYPKAGTVERQHRLLKARYFLS